MTRYNLAAYQVRAALENRLSIVTRPVLFNCSNDFEATNPFPAPGKTFVGTETFARDFWGNGVIYKADPDTRPEEWRWHSSAVMPSKYSRFLFTVVRRGVWRLGDVTEEQARAQGYAIRQFESDYNPDHWQFYAEVSVEVR